MPFFLIHGWATDYTIWPDWLSTNAHCYHSLYDPDYSSLTKSFVACYQKYNHPLTLVGWSLGGMLALQLAVAHPEKIEKLILIASTPRFTLCENYNAGLAPSILKNLSRKLLKDKWQTQLDFYNLMFSPQEDLWKAKFITQVAPSLQHLELPTLQSGLGYLKEKDLRHRLSALQTPCHILHGTEDTICLPTAGQQLADMLQNSKLTFIPGAGHIPFFTQEEYCKFHIFKEDKRL